MVGCKPFSQGSLDLVPSLQLGFLHYTGVISLRRPLTGKANLLVQLEVEAEDGGGLAAQPTAQINISIVAGTVSPPNFERAQYYFTVPEDTRPGSSVGSIHAHNAPGTASAPCLVTLHRLLLLPRVQGQGSIEEAESPHSLPNFLIVVGWTWQRGS